MNGGRRRGEFFFKLTPILPEKTTLKKLILIRVKGKKRERSHLCDSQSNIKLSLNLHYIYMKFIQEKVTTFL